MKWMDSFLERTMKVLLGQVLTMLIVDDDAVVVHHVDEVVDYLMELQER